MDIDLTVRNTTVNATQSFTLRLSRSNDPTNEYWLENQDGEGMGLSEKNLYDMINEFWGNNF